MVKSFVMIDRPGHRASLESLLEQFPVVGLLGARQVGKTTLARQLVESRDEPVTVFDLEDPTDRARLADPKLALEPLEGLVVIDEVQHVPDLFPLLRVLVDRPNSPARFLVLGSAGPDLLRQTSETLAGRIAYHELPPLGLDEVGPDAWEALWVRGGFPRSFLAEDDARSLRWRESFVRTFLERDLPQLGVSVPATTMQLFWTMVAHYHGERWSAAEIGRSLGVSGPTVRRYLDVLTDSLVVRQLAPWFENVGKRQVRSPKVYLADPGLLHALLGVGTKHELLGHPKVGASWEGFALGEVVRTLAVPWDRCYFWATHQGAELDLLVIRGGKRLGFELKRTSAPRTTRSMHSALETLDLERLYVVYPGEDRFPLHERMEAVGLLRLAEEGLGN
ncbi:MAG: ATP-binding protein [bacterium]